MINNWRDALLADHVDSRTAADSINELHSYTGASTTQLSALTEHLIFEVSGTDAQSFLQGQFCNDIGQVSTEQAQITGYCTPKGRLLALPTIVGFEGGFRLIVLAGIAEAFIKRLSMFVMRSDVTITPLDDWALVGITTTYAASDDELRSLIGELPEQPLAVSSNEHAQLIRWHDDHSASQSRQRYLRLAKHESQLDFWKASASAGKSSSNTWRLGDISAGIPSISQGVLETFVPQMLNLQLINALSFTKGCYPGQEIVARMQYLGKLKRHMRVFEVSFSSAQSFDINENLKPGVALGAGADENAGVLVDAMPRSENSALVLAVTKVAASEHPFTLAGIELAPREMPYELPTMDVA